MTSAIRPLAVLGLLAAVLLTSCIGGDPIYPLEPQVEFVSYSADTVDEYGSFDIILSYKDGDGDLGSNNGETGDLMLLDSRPGVPFTLPTNEEYTGQYPYNLPVLTPETTNPSIQGTITIEFPGTGIIGTDDTQPLFFRLYLKDRSGKVSDTITTPPIIIRRAG